MKKITNSAMRPTYNVGYLTDAQNQQLSVYIRKQHFGRLKISKHLSKDNRVHQSAAFSIINWLVNFQALLIESSAEADNLRPFI